MGKDNTTAVFQTKKQPKKSLCSYSFCLFDFSIILFSSFGWTTFTVPESTLVLLKLISKGFRCFVYVSLDSHCRIFFFGFCSRRFCFCFCFFPFFRLGFYFTFFYFPGFPDHRYSKLDCTGITESHCGNRFAFWQYFCFPVSPGPGE